MVYVVRPCYCSSDNQPARGSKLTFFSHQERFALTIIQLVVRLFALTGHARMVTLTRALRVRPPEVPEKAPIYLFIYLFSCFAGARAACVTPG